MRDLKRRWDEWQKSEDPRDEAVAFLIFCVLGALVGSAVRTFLPTWVADLVWIAGLIALVCYGAHRLATSKGWFNKKLKGR